MEGSSAQPPGHLSEEAEPSDGRSQCPRVELDRGGAGSRTLPSCAGSGLCLLQDFGET